MFCFIINSIYFKTIFFLMSNITNWKVLKINLVTMNFYNTYFMPFYEYNMSIFFIINKI